MNRQREEQAEAAVETETDRQKLMLTPLTPSYAHAVPHVYAVISCEQEGPLRDALSQENDSGKMA